MSYGVLASKVGHVQVEKAQAATAGGFDSSVPSPWGAGRLTLTSLHLTFVPTHAALGIGPLTIALSDIELVDTSPGRLRRVLQVRTADLVLRARVAGVSAFAKQLTISTEAARKRQASSQGWVLPDPDQPGGHH